MGMTPHDIEILEAASKAEELSDPVMLEILRRAHIDELALLTADMLTVLLVIEPVMTGVVELFKSLAKVDPDHGDFAVAETTDLVMRIREIIARAKSRYE